MFGAAEELACGVAEEVIGVVVAAFVGDDEVPIFMTAKISAPTTRTPIAPAATRAPVLRYHGGRGGSGGGGGAPRRSYRAAWVGSEYSE